MEGGEEIWREEERRWQLLPAWLFGGGAPRLRRLRLENAMGGCGPNIWEPDMVQVRHCCFRIVFVVFATRG